jgi:hypothetical protein
MQFLVQPICGMGNFMGSDVVKAKNAQAEQTGKVKESKESIDVYQAINVQLISWAPWDPFVLTQNAIMAKENRFASVGQLKDATGQPLLQTLAQQNPVERERELAKYKKEDAALIRLAMLPRFDQRTISDRDPVNPGPKRELCDVVENQCDPCEWKPEVDNPHCRFRHYILQPLTQAQMRLPVSQRHGFNQSAASSPNDPLFLSKLQENPNPYKYCVLPIVGFHQLERRVKMQDDKMKEQNAVLQSFENEVIRMREFQSVEYPIMLAQRRAKQVLVNHAIGHESTHHLLSAVLRINAGALIMRGNRSNLDGAQLKSSAASKQSANLPLVHLVKTVYVASDGTLCLVRAPQSCACCVLVLAWQTRRKRAC